MSSLRLSKEKAKAAKKLADLPKGDVEYVDLMSEESHAKASLVRPKGKCDILDT